MACQWQKERARLPDGNKGGQVFAILMMYGSSFF